MDGQHPVDGHPQLAQPHGTHDQFMGSSEVCLHSLQNNIDPHLTGGLCHTSWVEPL